MELSELDIKYRPRTAIKVQVLADFIMERSDARKQEVDNEKWVLKTDLSSQAQGGGVGIILNSSEGSAITQAIKLAFTVSNNEATRQSYWG